MPPRLLEGRLYLPATQDEPLRISSGSAPRSVHSKAWVAKAPCGSRTSTQRMGTAGSPVLYQTAVAEATSTVRSPQPYQSTTVAAAQALWRRLAMIVPYLFFPSPKG